MGDRLAELEQFHAWIAEHDPEAYDRYLRYGNRAEWSEPLREEPLEGGLWVIAGWMLAAGLALAAWGLWP